MMLGDEMKKIVLAGIGAVASTVELSQQMVEKLVKKGELTVEQGKVLNEELTRNVKDSFSKTANMGQSSQSKATIFDEVENLTDDERTELLKKLTEMETSVEGEE